jgi:hypothetical protein
MRDTNRVFKYLDNDDLERTMLHVCGISASCKEKLKDETLSNLDRCNYQMIAANAEKLIQSLIAIGL